MILTSDKILAEVGFEPAPDQFQVNPHSVDLRLEREVRLNPGQFTVVGTLEEVALPNDLMGVVYPRSSLNRRSVSLDVTGVVDANYKGHLILPMMNNSLVPITLLKGERVAQIVFHRLEGEAALRVSKYHGGDGSYKPDNGEETAYLASGDLGGLKSRYRL